MNADTTRVFFALTPDKPALEKLGDITKQLVMASGGYKTRTDKIHLTLLFVGNVNLHQLQLLRSIASQILVTSFTLSIKEIRYWKRNRVIYGKPQLCPELLTLAKRLLTALCTNRLACSQQTFMPHITLVRNASRTALPKLIEPVSWFVHEWNLIQSKRVNQRIDYISLDNWPLKYLESALS